MTRQTFRLLVDAFAFVVALVLAAASATAQTPPAYVFSGPMLPLLMQMPQNTWLRANANLYSSVWTPDSLEPLDIVGGGTTHTPSKIILAWSSFGWDSNRGDLILFGGGHANYSGNDVYRWHSSNLMWERASLPSEITTDSLIGQTAIDGVDNAPISSHTYDNNLFLPLADRLITWGGATYDAGGPFIRRLESDPTQTRLTGPYLFDPNRADGNKVGGTTGSNVQRVTGTAIAGGQMWQNRDVLKNVAGSTLPGNHINGCTGYAVENGKDVVYVAASSRFASSRNLHRYQLTDVANPAADQATQVGVYSVGVTGQTTCGYDPVRKLFVRTGTNSVPFQFWDLTIPGPTNPDQTVQINASIAALQSWLTAQNVDIQNCGLEYDPTRHTFQLWCGASTVWELTPPASGNTTSGWSIAQHNTVQPAPPGVIETGVMGKWRYAPFYDVFVGLQDINDGDIWIYKPIGWSQPVPPGDALPTVSITSPANGSNFSPATPISLTANASDTDGTIARVEYYINGSKVGQATTSPYTVNIAPILVGNYTITAIAVDNVGGMKASAPVSFTISATLTTAVLQRALNAYNGVSDTYIDGFAPTAVHGSQTPLYLDPSTYRPLVRFAIFQSEGGPVPDGAIVQTATLSLYKGSYDDVLSLNALLKPWVESQANWTLAASGVPWSVAGAAGAGTDFVTQPDVLEAGSFNPGWMDFDVTARVRTWSSASGSNFGWMLTQTVTNPNLKQFNSSEYTTDTTLRPKLTVVYSLPTATNNPPTVSLTSPANGASITLGQSFTVSATASDSDGTVTQVQFFANGTSIGVDTSAPYSITWTPSAAGPYTLTAVATDNSQATTTSAPVNVTVNPVTSGTTVVLQRGIANSNVADTFLDRNLPTTARNLYTSLLLNPGTYVPLVRFQVFQSEGGPVPDGATIQSATLSLYKQYYNETYAVYTMLKPWIGTDATWQQSQAGVPWNVAGAAGSGTDYNPTADALVAGPFNPGWINFNVTSRVQQWSSNATLNRGWKVGQTGTSTADKTFISSDYTTDVTQRPKLTVTYVGGAPPPPTTVVLQRDLNAYTGASDTYLDSNLQTTVRGSLTSFYLDPTHYAPLIRFAIFQSEGGPVPNGATIDSATLAIYKQFYDDTLRINALLKPWVEGQATWQLSQTGVPWSAGGASGAGSDYLSSADALVTGSFNPGWVSFNVTARVQQWASGGTNFGWRMSQTTIGSNLKQFNASEYTTDTTLRPKLTVVYH